MARPKGSKNNSSAQKQPAKTQQEIMKDVIYVTGEQLAESYNDSKIIENINETVEGVSGVAEQTIIKETQGSSNEEQKSPESPTINSEAIEPLSPSEDDKTAENASEEVTEVVAEDSSASPSGKFNVSGGTLAETVEKVLSFGYRGAEFGSKYPSIKKYPYTLELQVEGELLPEAPVFDSEEEYYTIVVRHYNPVDFMRQIVELGRIGVVIDLRDIGLVAKGVYQFKLFSPVPLNSSVYGLTAKPREPIVYSKERLEGFNDKQLDAIKTYLELSETKREDIIVAILEAQDK